MINFDNKSIKEILEILEIVEELRNTSSTNMKREILERNYDNEDLQTILELTYNPHKKYKITEKSLVDLETTERSRFDNLRMLTHTLAKENINDELRKQTNLFLSNTDEEIRNLYKGVLLKDLRIGVNSSTINKVWKGLIPTSESGIEIKPMLASKFDFDKPPKGNFYVSEKLDGIRCLAICREDSIELYTRQGKLIEGCLEIENDLKRIREVIGSDFVFDGEILANDCDYETVYKETTKRVKNKNTVKTGIHYVVFDLLTYDEFINKKCTHTYEERISQLKLIDIHFMQQERLDNESILTSVKIINSTLFEEGEIDNLIEMLNLYRDKGAEGLMVNLADALYEYKRSKNILKVKVMQTMDLEIVGFEEGTGRNKGRLGALLVDYKGNTVGVGSGFTDFDRNFIWQNQHLYLGRIAEIQYFEITKDKTGKESLRFPVYKVLREVGKEVSYH